ncbi:MAG: NAD-glutamate dehydrogenase [Pseudomonadota bacterium]
MNWDNLKGALLHELAERIDARSSAAHCQSLQHLAATFYRRFPPEDLRQWSVENLYGCIYGLLHFMTQGPAGAARVRFFNPDLQNHGWESKRTILVVLCPARPFLTASVRGELNQRGIAIHSLASCNVGVRRGADGSLEQIVAHGEYAEGSSEESLLYFEIARHSDVSQLAELRETLVDIVNEVGVVVDDFPAMRKRLHELAKIVRATDVVDEELRDEAACFIDWMQQNNMTFLGYEYLQVTRDGADTRVQADRSQSLGSLRRRVTRGEEDLALDLEQRSEGELLGKQLSFSKSRRRSRVHRQAYPDYVEVKVYDRDGRVTAQHRFIGLFTSGVYTTDPASVPILRRKVAAVMERSGLDMAEHDGRALVRTLELFPRDELFQSSIAELSDTVQAVNRIQERRQTRLFVRRDVHGKFVNCLVYIPRDRYTTERRIAIQKILSEAYGAEESEFNTQFSESVLVRCYFVLQVNPGQPGNADSREIEEQIVQVTLDWEDKLRSRLIEEYGEEEGEQLCRELADGFSPGYRADFDARVAVLDIGKIIRLVQGDQLAMALYRVLEEQDNLLRLRLYHADESMPLSDVLPILENLGLRVVGERPYRVRSQGGQQFWIQEFSLIYSLANDIDLEQVRDEFEDAFARIWFGEAESDSFNRLLLGTRLNWREIALLRAYSRYLRQINFPYSADYIAETMANHLGIAAILVEMFLTRFSPVFDSDEDWRAQRESEVEQRVLDKLDSVQNLGEDRIIRQYLVLIKATLRSNFFQQDADGQLKPYFSLKLKPGDIPDIPQPAPLYEVYVYSPRIEGVHLRGGKVARGGLRWSDRQEDFRTEVLGLVKAQQVKNAVIVPVGAKGGFVARRLRPDMTRDEVQEEGIACYQIFIRGLLDITDNRTEHGIVRPNMVVAKDEDDPYLVVAADKGTASFSDIANSLAQAYGFWLGDAFASGGSVGYDHKKMGITARGAWVSVQRHFREMGVDVQSQAFSVVGIGDMSGDVFGNGMLLSPHICLVAAFNHQHIFIDPDPDAGASFSERQRLFELPRSSWSDYDPALISNGGGVFDRGAKSIALSAQIKQRFDISEDHLTSAELVSRLLCADVDLLWNGGIGTYVKSSAESHTAVGDKANDSLRVDAKSLRCRVIGEGGNLGLTQLARVEFALAGGRCNTDFIDNAGGVDCSDHEVNIKILLDAIVARGELTGKQRDDLLRGMTDSVARLVLQNNYRQTQAISLAHYQAIERGGEYRRLITQLEDSGKLDRSLEHLPSDEELADRWVQGQGLSRPELAVLFSYRKGMLKEELIASDLGIDARLSRAVNTAFPERLVADFGDDIQAHGLRREIMCTQVANDLVNRMGLNFVLRQQKATGAPVADVARAYTTVMEVFAVGELWDKIEALDYRVAAEVQMDMMLGLITLVKRATRWLLRNRRHELAPAARIPEFGDGVQQLRAILPLVLRGRAKDQVQQLLTRYTEAGVDEELAHKVAGSVPAYTSLGIIQTADETGASLEEVATLYYAMGEQLELDWFANQILAATVENEWQALARDSFMEDLEWQQRTLTVGALRHIGEGRDLPVCLADWEQKESALVKRWRGMLGDLHAARVPDFAMFAVANRELLDLAQSSLRD